MPKEVEGPPLPPVFVGWYRSGSGPWTKVERTKSAKKIECYERLVRAVELTGGMAINNDLLVLPEGDRPEQGGYRDRMMRPTR